LFSVRLPRIIFAGIVGASLSLGGVIFRRFCAILWLILTYWAYRAARRWSNYRYPSRRKFFLFRSAAVGFCGSAGHSFSGVVVAGGTRGPLLDNSLLLSGVVVNAFFSAAILFFLSIVNSMELHSITFWLMGDLRGHQLKKFAWPLFALLPVLYCFMRRRGNELDCAG